MTSEALVPPSAMKPFVQMQLPRQFDRSSPVSWSLVHMADALRTGKVTPLALVEAHFDRVRSVNPYLNAFVEIYEAESLEAARTAVPGSGTLAGIPITIKDSFDVAGRPTLCGSRFRLGHLASRDATAVRRLRAAGAIVIGKTNTPEFLNNYETDNYLTGRTNHPLDPERTPGGSSGGEAAAIAAFCSAGGVGSDGGGSIRVPAHYCGIAGLKPTPGRVSAAGHFPQIAHPGGLLGVAGPLARSVPDVAKLFTVLAGYDPEDPFSAPVPARSNLDAAQTAVGLCPNLSSAAVEPDILRAVEHAGALLSAQSIALPDLAHANALWWFFFERIFAPFTRDLVLGREQDAHWTGMELTQEALDESEPTARDIVANLGARDALRSRLLTAMERCPVLLAPVCGTTAPLHHSLRGAKRMAAMSPATLANLVGFPALAVPFGRAENGMPIGVQLIGRPFEEELLLAVGERLELLRGDLP